MSEIHPFPVISQSYRSHVPIMPRSYLGHIPIIYLSYPAYIPVLSRSYPDHVSVVITGTNAASTWVLMHCIPVQGITVKIPLNGLKIIILLIPIYINSISYVLNKKHAWGLKFNYFRNPYMLYRACKGSRNLGFQTR